MTHRPSDTAGLDLVGGYEGQISFMPPQTWSKLIERVSLAFPKSRSLWCTKSVTARNASYAYSLLTQGKFHSTLFLLKRKHKHISNTFILLRMQDPDSFVPFKRHAKSVTTSQHIELLVKRRSQRHQDVGKFLTTTLAKRNHADEGTRISPSPFMSNDFILNHKSL